MSASTKTKVASALGAFGVASLLGATSSAQPAGAVSSSDLCVQGQANGTPGFSTTRTFTPDAPSNGSMTTATMVYKNTGFLGWTGSVGWGWGFSGTYFDRNVAMLPTRTASVSSGATVFPQKTRIRIGVYPNSSVSYISYGFYLVNTGCK